MIGKLTDFTSARKEQKLMEGNVFISVNTALNTQPVNLDCENTDCSRILKCY